MHLYTCTYKAGHVGTCPSSQCCCGETGGGGWGCLEARGPCHPVTQTSKRQEPHRGKEGLTPKAHVYPHT